MANGFSPQIYSEGNVVFDSTPSVRLAEQIANRRLAKDEAMDKYFNDLNKSLNPAGMRNQDVEGFMKKTNEMRDFYAKNKAAIRNPSLDNGKAYNDYYSRFQDGLGYINQSKQEAEKTKAIGQILVDPNKRSLVPDSVIDYLAKHELPLTDPTRVSFDPTKIDFNPKPFGIKEQQGFLKGAQEGIKMIPKIEVGPTDPKTFQQLVTTTESFDGEGKASIAERAASAYNSDPSYKKFIDDIAANDQQVQALSKTFQEDFGRPIKTPEDLSAAWTLRNIQNERKAEKLQIDELAKQTALETMRQKFRKEMAAITAGNQQALAVFKQKLKGASAQEANSWIDNLIDTWEEKAKKPENTRPYQTKEGQKFNTYKIPTTPQVMKSLGFDKDNMPDDIRFLDNGDLMYVTYQRYPKGDKREGQIKKGKNGEAAVDQEFSGRFSRPEFKALVGKNMLGVKAMNESLDTEGDFEEEEEISIAPTRKAAPTKTASSAPKAEDLRKKYDY